MLFLRIVHRTSAAATAASVLAVIALACATGTAQAATTSPSGTVNFSRDVLPLLSDNCLSCHGPDEQRRKADLRLDTREGALAALTPGQPGSSELIKRLTTADPDDLMPPAESHKPRLSESQVETLRRWITEGAPWGKHWAFEKPAKFPLPAAAAAKESHPIDALVAARLASDSLTLAAEAPRHTLIRRLSFDLTGLPPTPPDVAAFVADTAPDAYARLVDRLLGSQHFGERLAMWWLDAARYADTDGYQADATRTNWPWRDWVVQAFNANMPFDQFTLEQFAGDLLPNATADQKLATCFHRNHMTNGEGGRDPEESRIDYVIDRVNTTGTVWLGLTIGCAQCHTHKFDPVTHADYYRLAAFFNSIDEDGKAGKGAKPFMKFRSPAAARAVAEARQLVAQRQPLEQAARREAEAPFAEWLAVQQGRVSKGFAAWHPHLGRAGAVEGTQLLQDGSGVVQASGPNPKQDDYRVSGTVKLPRLTGFKLEVLPHASHTGGGLSRGKSGEFILTNVKAQVVTRGSSQVRELLIGNAIADYSAAKGTKRDYGDVKDTLDDDPRNGWTTKGADSKSPHTAVFALAEPYVPEAGEELVIELRHRSTLGDANIGRFRILLTDQPGVAVRSLEPAPLERLAQTAMDDPGRLDPDLRNQLFDQFLEDHAPYRAAKADLDRAQAQLTETAAAAGDLDVMVLAQRKQPRETHVLIRGVWDKKGEVVEPGAPDAIAPWQGSNTASRLDLARWLVSRDNPLTARVIVNHLWQMCFGSGLVRTPDDFGLQGQRPAHPELLDWLAVEFMDSGWDIKRLLKLIATSRTYRQDSAASSALMARDPHNTLLARGPRFRLPSWMLRDAALSAAGLLNPALGGPPVRPYQPPGVWEENFMGRFRYEPSEGAAQYRRTLYAFWRRSIAPTFLFDSAQRRVCEVSTARTNTPLQALTLLNDASYLEAARVLASQALATCSGEPERLRTLSMHLLSRTPSDAEQQVLQRELRRALDHYRRHPNDAAAFIAGGSSQSDARFDAAELAAYALTASLILNLDEAITHE